VMRNEKSGELNGLLRVRGDKKQETLPLDKFTQNVVQQVVNKK